MSDMAQEWGDMPRMGGTAARAEEAERVKPFGDGPTNFDIDPDPALEPVLADEVKLLPNGQIRMMIGGTLYLLRSPSMGQLRRYRVALVDLSKRSVEHVNETVERAKKVAAGESDPVEALEAQLGASSAEDLLADDVMRLLREIVSDLDVAGRRLPADNDDLPAWAPNLGMVVEFVKHWRRVPQAPGR